MLNIISYTCILAYTCAVWYLFKFVTIVCIWNNLLTDTQVFHQLVSITSTFSSIIDLLNIWCNGIVNSSAHSFSTVAQFSLNNVHKRGLKHHHFISFLAVLISTLGCIISGPGDQYSGVYPIRTRGLFWFDLWFLTSLLDIGTWESGSMNDFASIYMWNVG